MILQVIYSHENGQEIANFDFNDSMLETKEAFENFCLTSLQIKYSFCESFKDLKNKPTPKVWKLSACVYLEGESYEFPEWYTKCNGKVYFNQETLN